MAGALSRRRPTVDASAGGDHDDVEDGGERQFFFSFVINGT